MPKDVKDTNTTKINDKTAVTLLLDGNKGGNIYYYEGKLDENAVLQSTTLDPKRVFVATQQGVTLQLLQK